VLNLQLLLASSEPLDLINGLPVHPLVVHAAVVLVPLTALGAILMALIPKFSLRFGILVWIMAAVSVGAAVLAEKSGEEFAKRVGLPSKHAQAGELVKYYALALLAVTMIMWLLDRQSHGRRALSGKILAAIVIFVALAACYGVYLAGDSGARAVWTTILRNQ